MKMNGVVFVAFVGLLGVLGGVNGLCENAIFNCNFDSEDAEAVNEIETWRAATSTAKTEAQESMNDVSTALNNLVSDGNDPAVDEELRGFCEIAQTSLAAWIGVQEQLFEAQKKRRSIRDEKEECIINECGTNELSDCRELQKLLQEKDTLEREIESREEILDLVDVCEELFELTANEDIETAENLNGTMQKFIVEVLDPKIAALQDDADGCRDPHMLGLDGQRFQFKGDEQYRYLLLKDDTTAVTAELREYFRQTPDGTSVPVTFFDHLEIETCEASLSISLVHKDGRPGVEVFLNGNEISVADGLVPIGNTICDFHGLSQMKPVVTVMNEKYLLTVLVYPRARHAHLDFKLKLLQESIDQIDGIIGSTSESYPGTHASEMTNGEIISTFGLALNEKVLPNCI